MRYLFEDFILDTDRRELRREAGVVPTTPQVFDLIDYLIRHRERVVSKDDLISAIWNGRIVSDAALTTRLNAARAAIGDDGDQQRLIKTLPRKGFRFVGAVREGQRSDTGSARSVQNDDTAQQPFSPPHLSLVVLPFTNLSGDPQQDYFVDGVTESLTTDLSRISDAFVIAHNTALSLKNKDFDVRQIAGELNVRYVIEGSLQRSEDRVRVIAKLIDAETRAHLWADRFDKSVTDLFDMQDEIVSRVATALDAALIDAEARRAKMSRDPGAVDFIFQGKSWFNKGTTTDNMEKAKMYFEQALALDQGNVEALVGLASADAAIGSNFLTDDVGAHLAAAETLAIQALSRSPRHAWAHVCLAIAQLFTKRAASAIGECEQALALSRNLPDAHLVIGLSKLFMGRGLETEAHIRDAIRLSPRDSRTYRWMSNIGLAKQVLGADDEATVWFRRCIEANHSYAFGHIMLAASLVATGSLEEARAAARAGLALDPTFTIRRLKRWRMTDDPTLIATAKRNFEAMLVAGLPKE
jgi:TolB-like protein/Tfp pilus assembly protein PilF